MATPLKEQEREKEKTKNTLHKVVSLYLAQKTWLSKLSNELLCRAVLS